MTGTSECAAIRAGYLCQGHVDWVSGLDYFHDGEE